MTLVHNVGQTQFIFPFSCSLQATTSSDKKTKGIFNTIMAKPSAKAGTSVVISDSQPPLKAAISEVDKLAERFTLFTSSSVEVTELSAKAKIGFKDSGEELISCLSVMRRLMEEAEKENRQLKHEKILISSKIGDALGAVNREVEELRIELRKQDKRLGELNSQGIMKDPCNETNEELRCFKEEKERLQAENEVLTLKYNELCEETKNLEQLREQVHTYKEDIGRANETINCINSERRRLKSEKHDLVGQLREAYCIIEDKESELRDFIITYEERMHSYEQQLESITKDKRLWEDEKRIILSHNTPAQIGLLKRQLHEKDNKMREMEVELLLVKDQLNRLRETLKCSADNKWDLSPAPTVRIPEPVEKIVQSQDTTAVDGKLPSTNDRLVISNPEIYANRGTDTVDLTYFKKRKRYSRLSRVFSRGKSKKTGETAVHRPFSSLSSDGDSDSSDIVQIWETNKNIPISRWKSSAVMSFLYVHLQMPMYTARCLENVKSGQALADMSDQDLTKALGIISYIHRRKIRLAIEDFRHPASVKYPKIGDIDHHFVAHDWLTHIGLDQYAFTFETQMVDGRLLSSMSRKDIEKYLNITSKLHQDSILYGVQLLKVLNYDRELLAKRKEKCDEFDQDLLVWSNERVITWCDSIKLKDYSSKLRSTGVHGAFLVLSPTFGPDELARCLGIPEDNTTVRKHLLGELSSLMINARSSVKSRRRRSFINRSKSFNRHSFRKTGGYDVIDGNSNDGEFKKFSVVTRKVQNIPISPDISVNRRRVTLERPKSTDCERDLIE